MQAENALQGRHLAADVGLGVQQVAPPQRLRRRRVLVRRQHIGLWQGGSFKSVRTAVPALWSRPGVASNADV